MVGLAAGVVTAIFAGRLIGSLLFDVSANDPRTLAVVVLVVATVALVACFVPAAGDGRRSNGGAEVRMRERQRLQNSADSGWMTSKSEVIPR